MLLDQRLAVVVPAYNTGERVALVVATLPPEVDLVVVVDDASDDHTPEVLSRLRDPRVEVVRHGQNKGVGGALVTGYLRALDRGADLVAVMAGDAQMDPADLVPLCTPVARGEADYAKGDRLHHPSCARVMPPLRLAGNLALSAMTRAATGLWHVTDSQCGYTVISRRALLALDIANMWTRYGYPNHLLGALALQGLRVADVVVRPVYAGERSGVRWRDALVTIPRILGAVAVTRLRGEDARAPRLLGMSLKRAEAHP